jgi:hypothetical protein
MAFDHKIMEPSWYSFLPRGEFRQSKRDALGENGFIMGHGPENDLNSVSSQGINLLACGYDLWAAQVFHTQFSLTVNVDPSDPLSGHGGKGMVLGEETDRFYLPFLRHP